MSKFSVKLDSLNIIPESRFFCRPESTKKPRLIVESNTRYPCTPVLPVRNSFESTGVVFIQFAISRILRARALTEIISSIVQRVMVLMVCILTLKNCSVHGHFSLTIPPASIKTSGVFRPKSMPVVLGKPPKIFGINNRILSLRKWDKAVGFIQRLNNFVSADREFHSPTSHGIVTAAILT